MGYVRMKLKLLYVRVTLTATTVVKNNLATAPTSQNPHGVTFVGLQGILLPDQSASISQEHLPLTLSVCSGEEDFQRMTKTRFTIGGPRRRSEAEHPSKDWNILYRVS